MRFTHAILALTVACCVAPPATAQMSQDEAMKLAQQYQERSAGSLDTPPEPVELTEKDVKGFIGAIEELKELGLDSQIEADQSGKLEMSEALAANDEAKSILDRHGFSPEKFQRVVYSVGYALAAVQMEGREAEIDQAWAAQEDALEKMKSKLTPEQMQIIRSQAGMAKASMHRIEEQPPGNLELVEKHMDEIMRVVEAAAGRR